MGSAQGPSGSEMLVGDLKKLRVPEKSSGHKSKTAAIVNERLFASGKQLAPNL